MSTYDLGAVDDFVGAPLVVTPAFIKAEMETVEAAVRQLETDVAASKARVEFKKAFAAFVAEWRKFYGAHQSWTSRLWAAAYSKVSDFRVRLETWRTAFVREGGQPVAPSIKIAEPTVGGFSSKTLVLLAGGVVAAWALSSIAQMRK